jgi:hypothetical protein
MNRQSPPGERPTLPAAEAPQWMNVRVRVQPPLPQGDGDHGAAGESPQVVRIPRFVPDESGYGHGV